MSRGFVVLADIFRKDPKFEENEAMWIQIRKEILGESDDESDGESGSEGSGEEEDESSDEEEAGGTLRRDRSMLTSTNSLVCVV